MKYIKFIFIMGIFSIIFFPLLMIYLICGQKEVVSWIYKDLYYKIIGSK